LLLVFVVLLNATARAQLKSGPEVGAKLEPFKVQAATGDQAGQEVDFVAERKGKLTVFLFVQAKEWDRPMARYLKTLDEAFARGIDGADDPRVVAVWLTDNVQKSKDYLPRAQESLQFLKTTLAVFPGDESGPGGWELHAGARLTAVVVRDGKVVSRFGYNSVNGTDVRSLLMTIEEK